ncbi:MAG: cytochrome c biogenesis protein CcsA [Proteobacteria bacterium]|nr:cytochrome c biogenesis protein CcsA [Pseudomonadota bacterium]
MSLTFHVWLSLITLLVVMFAGLLALLLAIQEKMLKSKSFSVWVQRLPPLETMESRLFMVNRCGFALLTLVLLTSFYFYHTLVWQKSLLLSKTLLTFSAWIIFLILLLGRRWRGWRGAQAVNSTLIGLFIILIIYLSSRISVI